jgi:hypothetical protein
MNLCQCDSVDGDSGSHALTTIRVSLWPIMKYWCFIEISRAECHQLSCYIALGNASLGRHFIAHIRFESPQAPVYKNQLINCNYLLSISGGRKKIMTIKIYLSWIHLPILYWSTKSAFTDKMHDNMNHASEKTWEKYPFHLA